MAELKDYSGDFKPDLKLEDFSTNFLLRIIHAWLPLSYVNLDKFWFEVVKERTSEQQALECQMTAWRKTFEISAPKLARTSNIEDLSKDSIKRYMRQIAAEYTRISEYWYKKVEEILGTEQAFKLEWAVWHKIGENTIPEIAKSLNIEVKDVLGYMKISQVMIDGSLTGQYPLLFDIKNRNHVIMTMTRCATLEFFEKEAPHRIIPVCHDFDADVVEAYVRAFLPKAEVKALKLPPRKSQNDIACSWEIKLASTT